MENKEIEELLKKFNNADTQQFNELVEDFDNVYKLLSYIEQLEKDKKELKERYDLVCKISEERKNKWLSLNEENENLFNILKKYKLECESNGKIIHQLQNNKDKALNFIEENSYKKGEGTIMYDGDIDELEEILKGDSDE